MTFARDPISSWLDVPAQRFLARAYADYGQWAYTWLPQPTRDQRAQAAMLGIILDAADEYGTEPNRWLRAFKRSARWNLRTYGYARELRPGRARLDTRHVLTCLIWDSTAGLVSRPPVGERRWQVRAKLYPNGTDPLHPITPPADEWQQTR